MKIQKRYSAFLLALLLSTFTSIAQDKSFRHLTPSAGLSSGFVYEIIEDRYGYMWIGTNVGLNRYNGYEFINYTNNFSDPSSIKGTTVSAIIDYDSSTLLLGTEQGLNIYNRSSDSFKLLITNDSSTVMKDVIDIHVLPNKDLWVFTATGLFFITRDEVFKQAPKADFYSIETKPIAGGGLFGSLNLDQEGDLWLTSTRQPLQVFSTSDKAFKQIGSFNAEVSAALNRPVWASLLTSDGDLLLGGDAGLIHWKKGEKQPTIHKTLGDTDPVDLGLVQWLAQSNDGSVLIGTAERGGVRWNKEKNVVDVYLNDLADKNSISSNDIHVMYEDTKGSVWFGHHNLGISLMNSNQLAYSYVNISTNFGEDSPLNNLFHVTVDEDENLWFPTRGGLILYSSEKQELSAFNTSDSAGFVVSADMGTDLFVVTADGTTMYTFSKDNERFQQVYQNDSMNIHGHYAENNEWLFFPTVQGNIVRVQKKNLAVDISKVPESDLKSGVRISGIEKDAADDLITELFYQESRTIESFLFDPEANTFTKFENEREITPATRVPPIPARYEPKTMWERSVYGIRKTNLENGNSRVFFESEPLIQESQRGTLVEDDEGYVWMNTSTGIMQLDMINERITQYTLPTTYQPERLVKPFLLDSSQILFTGYGGFLRFNADRAKLETPIDRLYIDKVILDNESIDLAFSRKTKSFDYADNDLSISYFAINYPDPNGTRYRYRVIGQNENWTEVGGLRRVFLANLPFGKYRFEVQAALRYGGYDITQSFDFVILPPWWRTWWAYLCYLLIAMGLGLVVHRYQKDKTIQKERERIKDEQLAQAEEIKKAYSKLKDTQQQLIHSEKMASLGELTAGIAHEIQNPLNFVNNFSDVSEEIAKELNDELQNGEIDEAKILAKDLIDNLQKIHHHGNRASEIVKSMLQHSRTGSGEKEPTDLNVLADEYLRLAYHGLKAKDRTFNAKFKTELDPALPKVNVVPQDIGRVLLNLINNAFQAVKNVDAPEVVIRTKKADKMVELEIIDNGPGIAEELWVKIFQPFFTTKATGEGTGLGLSMSFDIITKGHGGTISVENSKSQSGAIFKISLPI